MDEIEKTVKSVIIDRAKSTMSIDEISDEAQLMADLGASCVALVMMKVDLELRFGIDMTDKEVEAINTVGDCVELVRKKVEAI